MAIRTLRRWSGHVSLAPLAVLLLGACGGGDVSGRGCEGSAGPDTSGIRPQLLTQIDLETGGAAQIARFEETARHWEGDGETQSCRIEFDGEIEFTGDAYYGTSERKAGDRVPFTAEAEFLDNGAGWERSLVGIQPG